MAYPALLKIGSNVKIAHGVVILTHDYSWSILAGIYGECLGGVAPVTIGDNVFIGINSIVLKGVKIGNNVIVGAGSVVSKDCDDNSVYAGIPARKICSIEEYYNEKKSNVFTEIDSIIDMIDTNQDSEIKHYLREYSCLLEGPFTDKEKDILMSDTGFFEKC